MTDRRRPSGPGTKAPRIERYSRPARWFHAAIYVVVLILLGTGWWLLAGQEGNPSPLSRVTGTPDTSLHKIAGWALVALIGLGLLAGGRGVVSFVAESVRFRRSDGRWFTRWPAAVFTGRFAPHDGHFDPGQRVLNLALVAGLAALTGSGVGMVLLHGGSVYAALFTVHRWATYVVTVLIIGHVGIAAGILPGYRGVWRSMHLGGKLDQRVAARLWPGWTTRQRRCPMARNLGAFVLGALDRGEHAEVERHIKTCVSCAAEAADLARAARML